MGGYIGAKSGVGLVNTTLGSVQDLTATDASPEVTLINSTHEDTDGGREGKVIFKGQQSGGEESTLAEIQASHDGTADDEKGDLIFKTNDGSDGASPTERLRIDSAGSIIPATLGTNNTHLGDGAGESIASGGQRNTFVGNTSGQSTTTGDFNSAFGNNSLNANVTGTHNTAIGDFSLALNTGNENTAVGQGSLEANTSGANNVAVGKSALGANTTASNSTAVGKGALTASTGAFNTAVGSISATAVTSGARNTALGYGALQTDTKGSRNVGLGFNALGTQNFTSATDSYNIGVGYDAGGSITTGQQNVLIGALTGDAITDGSNNVAVGNGALGANTRGAKIVAVGNGAGRNFNFSSSVSDMNNVFIGHNAGEQVTTGSNNVVIGTDAAANSSAMHAGGNLTTGTNHVLIGRMAHPSSSSGDAQVVLGFECAGSTNSSLTFGKAATDSRILFGGTSISAPSDERFKENIETSTAGLGFINDLRPVTFRWKKSKDLPSDMFAYKEEGTEGADDRVMGAGEELYHGFIAQEVKAAIDSHSEIEDVKDLWGEDVDGRQRVGPSALIPMLVKAIQELSTKNDALESQNTTQATQIADLITRVTALEAE